jgi:hypothetical protein
MENKIYTIEEINAFIDILKKNLNTDFDFENLYPDEINKNRQYFHALRKITHTTRDEGILSKTNLIDLLNNEIIKNTDSELEGTYYIEAINEFINILKA